MKKTLILFVATLLLSGLAVQAQDDKTATTNATKAAAAGPMIYSCDKCHMEAKEAGKCPMCGEEMKARRLMTGKDGKQYVCECPPTCNCTLKEEDKTQCTCGKKAKEVKLMEGKDKAKAQ